MSAIVEYIDTKRPIVLGLVVFILILGELLYICGMAAWDTDVDTVMDVFWASDCSAIDTDSCVVYGLRSYAVVNFNNDDSVFDNKYNSCESTSDSCKTCESAGATAMAMSIMAFFFSIVVIILTGVRMMKLLDKPLLKKVAIGFTAITLLWTIVAVGTFNNQCIATLPIVEGSTGYNFGPGYNCVATNIAWLIIALIVHILLPAGMFDTSATGNNLNEPLTDSGEKTSEESPKESKNQA